jgi:uncharacterized protein YndB with AHSA1/START domain
MTGRCAAASDDANSLRKTVRVAAPPDVAWRVFTQKMGSWWPLASHKIGKAKAVDAVIEPHVGGRWYERGDDGSTCDWGHVQLWDPPTRLILTWEINADFQSDPTIKTEVEVRFAADGQGTRVDLEHRKLNALGARRDQMRGIFDSDGGWTGLLNAFARVAFEEGTT